jgi:hypothetical protein
MHNLHKFDGKRLRFWFCDGSAMIVEPDEVRLKHACMLVTCQNGLLFVVS